MDHPLTGRMLYDPVEKWRLKVTGVFQTNTKIGDVAMLQIMDGDKAIKHFMQPVSEVIGFTIIE